MPIKDTECPRCAHILYREDVSLYCKNCGYNKSLCIDGGRTKCL